MSPTNSREKYGEPPKAVDLSHHLSEVSKARSLSPLKGYQKYFNRPGMIMLAGGLPDPAYFPIANLSADTLVQDSFDLSAPPALPQPSSSPFSWLWNLFSSSSQVPRPTERTAHISIPKYPPGANPAPRPPPGSPIALAQALQYGAATGIPQLSAFLREFTEKVFQPAYSDWETLVHVGNTDGWSRAVQTLCNPHEFILAEEFTYPSALASAHPFDVRAAAVKIDGQGMRSDDLRSVLEGWDEEARGGKRPHVMYTVPVGQNPTGATMGAKRKKEIYDICVEFDVIIVEDDPYYFLQEGAYVPKDRRSSGAVGGQKEEDEEAFLARLAPSFIKFDYQGRVIRLDSFSKTIAPGSRLGWFTCSPLFAERLERQGETSTQGPCGFSQALVAQLLTQQWGYKGFIRWLRGLGAQYTFRRDYMVDLLHEHFDMQPTTTVSSGAYGWGGEVYVARAKAKALPKGRGGNGFEKSQIGEKQDGNGKGKILFSLIPPTSGMFVWLNINFEAHPSFKSTSSAQDPPAQTLEEKFWLALAEAGLLVAAGLLFSAERDADGSPSSGSDANVGHLRMSFSFGEHEIMKKGIIILEKVLREFFEE
ncbi:PLP-dependent transferase [Rickenella mellea]|uniref:PLP-dependent transferase n=1 Tax=Rickenella mellea TaxID=50990 RepID=A0A4R5XFR0_9AGAM|nr:PLP-dependent transferase [Rickenella mellea]